MAWASGGVRGCTGGGITGAGGAGSSRLMPWTAWTLRISSGLIRTVPRGLAGSSTTGLGSTKVIWIWPRVTRSPSWSGEDWTLAPFRRTPLLLPRSWIS